MINGQKSSVKLVIATPVFNDWESFNVLLHHLDSLAGKHSLEIEVVAVDDGSTELPANRKPLSGDLHVSVIRLARNLGHQKAISIGLSYISENIDCDAVVVMDSDGEDNPESIPALIAACQHNPQKIIFAKRSHRSEGVVFNLFYTFYKFVFFILTGKKISFGNFSLIPHGLLRRVCYLPEIWNHYAAGVMHAKLPWESIPVARTSRYQGKTKMNFVSLILHGLSAMSVYIEILTIRLMIFIFFIILLGFIGFGTMLYYRLFTELAIPGWATNVSIGLTIILLQALFFLVLLIFLVLNHRGAKLFIPAINFRDYFSDIKKYP